MNANQIAQVAQHLNVSPNQIKRCEEWASVLFVIVHGCRPRFVSKKAIKAMVKVKFSGIVPNRGGSVQVFSNGLKYLTKKRQSNKYSIVEAELEAGTILKLEDYFATAVSKKSINGWFQINESGKLEEIAAPTVETRTTYLHEIYEEIANPTDYKG